MGRRTEINSRGLRIGEGHPMAVLTDQEVEQLIRDRGPEDAPAMSLAALAKKWGMSKSGVKAIVDGRNRTQRGLQVSRKPGKAKVQAKVRVKLTVSLYARAKLHRLGGARWLEQQLEKAQA